jgi:outer membrane immunogenic protein
MKKALAFSAIALPVAILASVSAPNLAVAQAVSNWSGANIGISGDGVWGSSTQHDNGVTGCTIGCSGDGHYNVHGWLAGGGGGYNWQNGPWVAGITGDLSGGSVKGSSPTCGGVADVCGTKLNQLGTVRGLFGYANGQFLYFVTAGPAFGHVSAFDTLSGASGSKWESGVAFGGGLDIMLSRNMSFKIEYLRFDFGKSALFDFAPGVPEHVSLNGNMVRVGLTWYPR